MSKKNRDYRVGAPQTDRVPFCTTKADGPLAEQSHFVEDKELKLQQYSIDIDVPRYRLENNRTKHIHQPSYIKTHKLDNDHFSDVENDQAQIDQHKILVAIARGNEGKKVGFEEEMKGPQKHPIVVQGNGEILSGNTRMSIWRELYHTDPDKYKHHAKIDILYYPTINKKSEMEFENDEDIKKNVKIPYNWYGQASTFESQLEDMGYTMKRVVKMSGKTKKTIETLIDSKNYAQEFLKKYKNVSPMDLVGDNTQYSFRGISEVCSIYDGKGLTPERIVTKKLLFMTIRRSVLKDKKTGKPEIKLGGQDKYKLFKTLTKVDDSNNPHRLNTVIQDISNSTGDKDIETSIANGKSTASEERDIVRQTLASLKKHHDADSQETYQASISAARTSANDALKNWITNGKEKIDSQTKQGIKEIIKTLDKFFE